MSFKGLSEAEVCSKPEFICSKATMEKPERCVKCVES